MGNTPLTTAGWALGRRLRRYREVKGLDGKDVAALLRVTGPTVTRFEKGKLRLTEQQLGKLCAAYDVSDDDAAALEVVRVESLKPDWRQDFPKLTDGPLGDVLGMETGAARIKAVDGLLVPGLVQIEDYATALMQEAPYIRASEVRRRVALRMRRQEGVRDGRQTLVAFIGAAAFEQTVGGPAVMQRQVARLREMATEPNVMIRVMPFSAGAYPGLGSSFTILDFDAETDLPTVVCVDTLTSALTYEQPQQVETYTQSFDMMMPRTLGETETIEHFEKIERDLLSRKT